MTLADLFISFGITSDKSEGEPSLQKDGLSRDVEHPSWHYAKNSLAERTGSPVPQYPTFIRASDDHIGGASVKISFRALPLCTCNVTFSLLKYADLVLQG
jgi:hypothetical protein